MNLTLIYALRDNHWIRYVGKTCNALEWRLADHLKAARKGDKSHRGRGIRKMFSEGRIPRITLLEMAEGNGSKEEISWITYFRSYGIVLWNETDGGDGYSVGHAVSEEARKKISSRNRSRKGSHHSIETKRRMSQAHIGHHISLSTKMKISLAEKGKKIPLDQIEKNRIAQLGRKATEETKRKMSLAHMGHSVSITARLKSSQTQKGRPGHSQSPETRMKISKTMAQFYQRTNTKRKV